MVLNLINNSKELIGIECCGNRLMIPPNENAMLPLESSECSIKFFHFINDRFNFFWYILNEIFTLEQMRTVLVVDGECVINGKCHDPILKIKNHEFVFHKKMSYHAFVFSANGCSIIRKHLEIAQGKKILKRAKILYLFGGSKTIFPLAGIALIASLFKICFSNHAPTWFLLMTFGLAICFFIGFIKYIKSLKQLKIALSPSNILKYFNSSRIEMRKFSDDLVQKYLNTNADNDIYM